MSALLAVVLVTALGLIPAVGVALLGRSPLIVDVVARLKRTRIADVRVGPPVKVVGKIEALEPPLTSPVTQTMCVAYWFLVEIYEDGWKTVHREVESRSFQVRDDSGDAIVLADRNGVAPRVRVQALLPRDRDEYGFGNALRERGIRLREGEHYFLREGVLVEGEEVAVLGPTHLEASLDPRDAAGYRDLPTRLCFRGDDRHRLYVCNEARALMR